jgi:hypothetical protein
MVLTMRLPIRVCCFAVSGLPVLAGPAIAATRNTPAVTSQVADSLLQHQDWPAAVQAYDALTRSEPANGRYWYRLGAAQYGLKRYHEAVDAWTHSEAIGHNPVVMYNLGVGYALLNDKDRAFEWLGKAVTAGFQQEVQLQNDADLAGLRSDPRYAQVAAQVHAATVPCESRPESHQFDFWIGDWDVKSQQGQLVGHSHIDQILGQCVILENWTGLQGGSGKSFNSYDTASSSWRQFWVDDRGTVTEFTDGVYKDGALRFLTHSKAPDGSDILGRLSFYNLGPERVRQWKERSMDAGKTWTTDYDFVYDRKH